MAKPAKLRRNGNYPTVTETPKYLAKSLTIYYKHNIGAYSGVGSLFSEVRNLLPAGATTFGIYYDNPGVCSKYFSHFKYLDGEDLYTDNYAQQLNRWGYERMVLPKVFFLLNLLFCGSTYFSPTSHGFLPLNLFLKPTYSALQDNRLETSLAIEFYDTNEICVTFPLDHVKEFMIPEYLPLEVLESKLNKKKFDSDEECSESDSDPHSEFPSERNEPE
uniref:Radial spoke head protein 9 homolog n=1 Tax=Angiostrongylus cantonensis TaxID=6313 RepID=A0A0K0DAL4_ANGCA